MLIHEHFRVRRATQPYSLQRAHRHDLQRHLTNTTLGAGAGTGAAGSEAAAEASEKDEEAGCPTETLHMEDFVAGFAAAHPHGPAWPRVRARVEAMLVECFSRLARAGARGLRGDPYGRALLGVDVLLAAGSLDPFLLELNAAPNVIGIVAERPAFWDEVFTAAFIRSGGGVEGAFRPLGEN